MHNAQLIHHALIAFLALSLALAMLVILALHHTVKVLFHNVTSRVIINFEILILFSHSGM